MNDGTTTCKIEGCERPLIAWGWCNQHYRRWKRHGDPMFLKNPISVEGTPEERFWAKVDAMGVCWEWTAFKNHDGYGQFRIDGRMKGSHRVAWEFLVGPISEGNQIDHRCRNRACCNPDHLEEVTQHENVLRGRAAIKGLNLKTHCKRGHEYNDENTYKYVWRGNPVRYCMRCRDVRERNRT